MTKPGYKHTELGWIPNEWVVKEFGEVFDFIKSESFSRDNLCYDYNEDCIFNIHYGDIHATYKNQILNFDTDDRIPVLKSEFHRENFEFLLDGDLIIADVSEDYEGIGECVELKNVKNRKVTGGLHTIIVRDNEKNTANGFRAYIFKNRFISLKLKQIATGISVYGVSKGNLSKLIIPLPPLPEQKKIAEILSTWDKAIERYELLVMSYEKLKKGLMQKLFSNVQLKIDNGEWKKERLSDICDSIIDGTHQTPNYVDSGIPFYSVENVTRNDFKNVKYVTEEVYNSQNINIRIKRNDILMTRIGSIGDTKLIDWDVTACIYVSLAALRINKKFITEYVFYYTKTALFKKEILSKSLTSAIPQKINLGNIGEVNITYPMKLNIQRRIGKLLYHADKQIELLKQQKSALEQQKKGLMQKLLTGEVRVKIIKN